MGDWRDPLDPDLDAQIIFSQFLKGRTQMAKKYMLGQRASLSLPASLVYHSVMCVCVYVEDGSTSSSTRGSSSSPTPSSGATSLNHDEEGGGASVAAAAAAGDSTSKAAEKQCRELMGLVDELKWYHEQCTATA